MSRRTPHGHTLPELLMGMALGLLVIAAATAAYGASRQSWAAMAGADAVHANARIALRSLREQAHTLGGAYLNLANSSDGHLTVAVSSSEETGQAALSGTDGSTYVEHITLGHWHTLDATDCQGNTGSTQATVRNDFKLNTNKELSCKDLNLNNSSYQALAEGVEDFQVRYAQANPDTQTLQWKTANQVTAMSQVVAIEVCLRVSSMDTVNHPTPNPTLKGCQGEALITDGHLRRVFTRVMALRNRDGVLP
jgi:type IV pilus assembly protein PilW